MKNPICPNMGSIINAVCICFHDKQFTLNYSLHNLKTKNMLSKPI